MAKHVVKCAICGQSFDLNSIQGVRHGARRYAHQTCYPQGEIVPCGPQETEEEKQEKADLQALRDYINSLYGQSANWQMINRQIKSYKAEYKYTYSGMQQTLKYCYEIRKLDITKAQGIGIVPYQYQNAYNYFYEIWLANQNNDKKLKLEDYEVPEFEIKIKPPKREGIKKKRLFSFLDL